MFPTDDQILDWMDDFHQRAGMSPWQALNVGPASPAIKAEAYAAFLIGVARSSRR